MGVKRRPAIIISTTIYHAQRPDMIVGLLTSKTAGATSATDYLLQDWKAAGLNLPTAFRSYLVTMDQREVNSFVGRLSDCDWAAVQDRLKLAIDETSGVLIKEPRP